MLNVARRVGPAFGLDGREQLGRLLEPILQRAVARLLPHVQATRGLSSLGAAAEEHPQGQQPPRVHARSSSTFTASGWVAMYCLMMPAKSGSAESPSRRARWASKRAGQLETM